MGGRYSGDSVQGFNEIEAIRRFQGKGLSGFVQKPYTAETLVQRIKAALE